MLLGLIVATAVVGCREDRDRAGGEARQPERANVVPPTEQPAETARRQEPAPRSPQAPSIEPRAEGESAAEGAEERSAPDGAYRAPAAEIADAVVCRPTSDAMQTVERSFEFADLDDDGRISREEAVSTLDLLIGGFFFQADGNGDGTITPAEAREARSQFFERNPKLATTFSAIRDRTGQSPFAAVAQLLDVDNDEPLTMAEARRAARASTTQLFAVVDTNGDGALTAEEGRQAALAGAAAAGRATFVAADTNQDGALSKRELEDALSAASRTAFDVADENDDGRLTRKEAAAVVQQVMSQIEVRGGQRTK
jgi:Ca2+-binding EF-hand superfamily protein